MVWHGDVLHKRLGGDVKRLPRVPAALGGDDGHACALLRRMTQANAESASAGKNGANHSRPFRVCNPHHMAWEPAEPLCPPHAQNQTLLFSVASLHIPNGKSKMDSSVLLHQDVD